MRNLVPSPVTGLGPPRRRGADKAATTTAPQNAPSLRLAQVVPIDRAARLELRDAFLQLAAAAERGALTGALYSVIELGGDIRHGALGHWGWHRKTRLLPTMRPHSSRICCCTSTTRNRTEGGHDMSQLHLSTGRKRPVQAPKHTPGPWRRIGHRQIVTTTGACLPICEVWSGGVGIDQADANEHLIAAAPELYAAALDALFVVAGCNADGAFDEQERMLRAALAKAGGDA